MKWFFRTLNLLVAAVAFFLLYQHMHKPIPPVPQPPEQIDQPADYPATVPAPVIELLESFKPLNGKPDQQRIDQATSRLDDATLREVLQSLVWDSEEGQALAGLLAERKLVARDDLQALEAGALKDLSGVRKCFSDPRCFPVLEKCLLTLKCCIIHCRCWPFSKGCCGDRWTSCCSKTIQVGLVGGIYKTVKKIRFDPNFSVALDGTDTAVITLNIPDNSISGAKIIDSSLDGAKLKDNTVGNGKLVDSYSLNSHEHGGSYAATIHDHGAAYAASSHGHSGNDISDGTITAGQLAESYAQSSHNHGGAYAANGHEHDAAYSHPNQASLDALTPAVVTNSHGHPNQLALDNLAQGVIDSAHGHPNQVLLNGLTQGVMDNSHNHPNQAAVNNLSQSVIDTAHAHINQAILAGLTQPHLDHATNISNPHSVTKAQIGLANVTNVAQIPQSEKGVANGVATLDANSNLVFDGGSAKLFGNGANTLSYSFGGTCRQVTTSALGGTCAP